MAPSTVPSLRAEIENLQSELLVLNQNLLGAPRSQRKKMREECDAMEDVIATKKRDLTEAMTAATVEVHPASHM